MSTIRNWTFWTDTMECVYKSQTVPMSIVCGPFSALCIWFSGRVFTWLCSFFFSHFSTTTHSVLSYRIYYSRDLLSFSLINLHSGCMCVCLSSQNNLLSSANGSVVAAKQECVPFVIDAMRYSNAQFLISIYQLLYDGFDILVSDFLFVYWFDN